MLVSEVIQSLETLTPLGLAEAWDKVGLQVGSPDADVAGGLLCIDLTEAVIEEAVQKKCGLVVAYHPPIFQALNVLRDDGHWTQRRIIEAVRAGLAVYSPHTALDATRGGVTDWLCDILGPGKTQPISTHTPKRNEYKLVVFVPEASEVAVREAVSAAGAGCIGNYRECSFSVAGTGGFRPIDGANPTLGKVGQREEIAERRFEMIVPGGKLAEVLATLRVAHPYEEPAFDLFKLEPEPKQSGVAEGAGRVLSLETPATAAALAERLKASLGVPIKLGGETEQAIQTVAVCPGSGGKLFESVEADAYFTGEMQHHQVLDLVQRGKAVLLAGHTNTERPYLPVYRERILKTNARQIAWHVSDADRCPLGLQ